VRTRVDRFWWATLGLVVLAVVIRVAFAFVAHDRVELGGDARVFREAGRLAARGEGFGERDPSGDVVAMAAHPPAFPAVLAVLDAAGVDSTRGQRIVVAAGSGLAVGVLAMLGRRLGSGRVGLVAAFIAAVHPLWYQPGGVLMSEALVLFLVPLLLYLALGVLRRPTWWGAAATGLCGGALVLTRSESALLVAAVGLTLLVLDRRPWRTRVASVVVLGAVAGALVLPWMVRNSVRVDSFTMSTNLGATVAGSYCPTTFEPGPRYGGWDYTCAIFGVGTYLRPSGPDHEVRPNEKDDAGREAAADFADDHLSEIPRVALARVGRLWGVFHPGDQLVFDVQESRHEPSQRVGQYVHWALLALAVGGAVVLPRRCWRTWALVALPVLTTTATAAVVYGSTRMRVVAEPTIALFAAVALVWAWTRLTGGATSRGEPDGRQAATDVAG